MNFFMGLLNLSWILGIFFGGWIHQKFGYEYSLLVSFVISMLTFNLTLLTDEKI